jgi:hypothetical protein
MGRPEAVRSGSAAQGAAGLRAFQRIAAQWGLTVDEQLVLLGGPARSTYYHWRAESEPALPHDTLERLSYVLGIYKALQILLPDAQRADEWVRLANDAQPFGGRSALERMLGGQVSDLWVVRQYVDAQLGGWS